MGADYNVRKSFIIVQFNGVYVTDGFHVLWNTQNQSCNSKRAMFYDDDTLFMTCPYFAAFDFMLFVKSGHRNYSKKKTQKDFFCCVEA